MAAHLDHVPDLGQPNGIATLDELGVHQLAQLLEFVGSTNLASGAKGVVPAPPLDADPTSLVLTAAKTWRRASSALPASIQAIAQERPGAFFAGLTIYNYPTPGAVSASEIQYTRVFLVEGTIINRGEVFVDTGSASRLARVGLYDQSDPDSDTLPPRNKVAETGTISLTGVSTQFIQQNTTATYTVPITGYYWVAFVVDSASPKFALTSSVYRANFLPVRRQVTTSVTLPATASGLTNPQSAVAYAAVLEQP